MFSRARRWLADALGTDDDTVQLYARARAVAECRLAEVDPLASVNQKVLNRVRALQIIAEERGRFYRPVKKEAV